jgi:hypothetical protein
MTDLPLLDFLERTPTPRGETFSPERDGARLGAQYLRVRDLMRDGVWRTLEGISAATGDPQASISARLRDMRRNGFTVERRYIANGLWEYRMVKP